MGFREVLATGAFPFDKIGHGVEPEPIHTKIEPEIQHLEGRGFHLRIVVVQIGLMEEEAMPEIGFGHWIVGPIAYFIILEDDSRLAVFSRVVGPYIVIAPGISGSRAARFLKPDMLIAGVIEHQLGDHAQPNLMRGVQKLFEIIQGPVGRIYGEIVGYIISIVPERRRIERQEPDRGNAKIFEIIQLAQQTLKISDAVIVGIAKGFDVQLIDDGFLEPERCWRLDHFGDLDL
jgi:hypothetical protein